MKDIDVRTGISFSDYNRGIMNSINNNSIVEGAEAFDYLNSMFFKLDKTIQSGIKGVINFFSTNNIYIENLADYKTKTPNINNLYSLRKTVYEKVKDESKFYLIGKKKTPVIMGLDITLQDLYLLLKNNSVQIKQLEKDMEIFDTVLDKFMNSKKDKLEFNLDKKNIDFISSNVDDINKDLDKVTNKKVLVDRVQVNKIVSSYKELLEITDNSISLGKEYNMERLESLSEYNQGLVVKLDAIYESMKKNKSSMKKDDLELFVKYITTMAKFTTAVSFLFYLYLQLLNMLVAIIKISETANENKGVLDTLSMTIKKGNLIVRDYFKQIVG